MEQYWHGQDREHVERGMYIIFPLKYDDKNSLKDISIAGGQQVDFRSGDFIPLMAEKCSMEGNFVRREKINIELNPIRVPLDDLDEIVEIPVTDLQLFVFGHGIAFLTPFLKYENKDAGAVYQFIFPGYNSESKRMKEAQAAFVKELEEKVLSRCSCGLRLSVSDPAARGSILKDAYRLNAAYVPNRFKKTDTVDAISYNAHRMIDLSRYFKDDSEKDVDYVTGAKDVDSEDYGWGCCITSQEISYVYAQREAPLVERAEDDLLLTMLTMYQKYSCMLLNEEIHRRYSADGKTGLRKKSIRELKREALEFIAYGTLAPSQISRWNNVCEIYRHLQEKNGIDEAIAEIREKIALLNEEQERIDSAQEGKIGMIIAVFGLLSIVASVLQIVDYMAAGRTELTISFWISTISILIFGFALSLMMLTRKKRNGDV